MIENHYFGSNSALPQARRNEIDIGGAASEASKNGDPGASPRETFLRPRPLDRRYTPRL